MLFSSILMVAAYIPRNHLKIRMGHPMVLSVKVWALSHLLANGNLADMLLFGAFLIWALLNFKSARVRDRVQVQLPDSNAEVNAGVSSASLPEDVPVKPNLVATLITLAGGIALWAVITFVLHAKVVGVAPMG
jgi:uncharacterized membrane protein